VDTGWLATRGLEVNGSAVASLQQHLRQRSPIIRLLQAARQGSGWVSHFEEIEARNIIPGVAGDQHLVNPEFNAMLQAVFACSADIAASIGGRATERYFPLNAIIVRQGDHCDSAFLLLAGRANALSYGVEGQTVLLHEYRPGDFFGAVGFPEGSFEDAEVLAVERSRTAIFLALDFLALLERHGCVGVALSRALMRQLRATAGKVVERSTLSAAGRIHAELLRLARLGDGRSIDPAPVLSKLAMRVNTTRETASRTINALLRRGIAKRERGKLVIVSPRQLEEMIV